MMPSGINAHVPSPGNKTPPKRGITNGWTRAVASRNRRFLMSVQPDHLDGFGYTFTLTTRGTAGSSLDFTRRREALFEAMRRAGMIRLHWVTEWQRRGAPHLHICAFFPCPWEDLLGRIDVVATWVRLNDDLGCSPRAQHAFPLHHAVGWFGYVAKHAARGVLHYQRNRTTLPKGWQSTGRMWGHGGIWPLSEEERDVTIEQFWRLRRLVRSWLTAQARSQRAAAWSGNQVRDAESRLWHARKMLRCTDRRFSPVKPIGHWVPASVQARLLDALPPPTYRAVPGGCRGVGDSPPARLNQLHSAGEGTSPAKDRGGLCPRAAVVTGSLADRANPHGPCLRAGAESAGERARPLPLD
jgi:hypothetical protein